MSPKKQMPEFATDAEEANWLYEHRHDLDDYTDEPTTEQLTEIKADLAKLKRSEAISLRLPASDLARAKTLAERKAMGYQTYLKSLIRQGLDRDEQQHLQEVAVLLAADIGRLKGAAANEAGFDADLFRHLQMMADLVDKLGLSQAHRQSA